MNSIMIEKSAPVELQPGPRLSDHDIRSPRICRLPDPPPAPPVHRVTVGPEDLLIGPDGEEITTAEGATPEEARANLKASIQAKIASGQYRKRGSESEERAIKHGKQVTDAFVRRHPLHFPSDTNKNTIVEYMEMQRAADPYHEWSLENLEKAFAACRSKLVLSEDEMRARRADAVPQGPSPEQLAQQQVNAQREADLKFLAEANDLGTEEFKRRLRSFPGYEKQYDEATARLRAARLGH